MERSYATAELQWPSDLRQGPDEGRFCTPAHFEGHGQGDWSLFVWLDQPAQPGASVTAPVTPLVSEAASDLLKPGTKFQLFVRPGVFAAGRIVNVVSVSQDELKCVFHFC